MHDPRIFSTMSEVQTLVRVCASRVATYVSRNHNPPAPMIVLFTDGQVKEYNAIAKDGAHLSLGEIRTHACLLAREQHALAHAVIMSGIETTQSFVPVYLVVETRHHCIAAVIPFYQLQIHPHRGSLHELMFDSAPAPVRDDELWHWVELHLCGMVVHSAEDTASAEIRMQHLS